MTNLPTDLLALNKHLLNSKKLLIVEPPDAQSACYLQSQLQSKTKQALECFTSFFGIHQTLSERGFVTHFHANPKTITSQYDAIVIYNQKSQRFNRYLIEQCQTLLDASGSIIFIGENKAGIKSWKKRLLNYGEILYSTNGRHCTLYQFIPFSKNSLEKSYILDGTTNKKDATESHWLELFQVVIDDNSKLEMSTLPGVFSDGSLDKGTEVLLSTFDTPISGNILDFACGCGIIGCYLKKTNPLIHLSLSDVSAMALTATAYNLKQNNLAGQCIASDGLEDINDTFDYIISNPPFHKGIKTDYTVTENFLRNSYKKLKRNGFLRIVANDFLRYSSYIEQTFGNYRLLKKTSGFSVYEAQKR